MERVSPSEIVKAAGFRIGDSVAFLQPNSETASIGIIKNIIIQTDADVPLYVSKHSNNHFILIFG